MLIRRILYAMSKRPPGLHNLMKNKGKTAENKEEQKEEEQQKLSPEDEIRREFHLEKLTVHYNKHQETLMIIGRVLFLQFIPPAIQGIRLVFEDPITHQFAHMFDDLNLMATMTVFVTTLYRLHTGFETSRQNKMYRLLIGGSLASIIVVHAVGAGIFTRISTAFFINGLLFTMEKLYSPTINLKDQVLKDPFDENMQKLITKTRLVTSVLMTVMFIVQLFIMQEKQKLKDVVVKINTDNKKQNNIK